MTDDLVKLLREVSLEKNQEAWARSDGGQDLTIGAMLADEAADRIEELEAKLAQQDDLMQAAVAAALREAAGEAAGEIAALGERELSPFIRRRILALITPDAQAALDRVVAAERERCAKVAESRWRSWGQNDPHGPVECDVTACENIAAAIRKGDTP